MVRRSRRRALTPSPEKLEEAGRFLREARRRRNLTQTAVARRASYSSHQTVLHWEAGQLPWRDRSRMLLIVRAYRLHRAEADDLFALFEYPESPADAEWQQFGEPMEGVQPMSPGAAGESPDPSGSPPQTRESPEAATTAGVPPAAVPPMETLATWAERRQVTLVLSNLDDFTALAERLTPEQLGDLVRRYQDAGKQVGHRFDGKVEEQREDSILLCFGYRLAHDDDPQRAVSAGLELARVMGQLNAEVSGEARLAVAARVSVHTGVAVVNGPMGGAGEGPAVLGETRNVAAALQAFTDPGTVIIGEATHRLVEGYFTCREVGAVAQGHQDRLGPVYQALGKSDC